MDQRVPLQRRLKAARQLAGYTNVEQLAEAIDSHGLGAKKLRQFEQGTGNPPERRDLWEIAQACRVPLGFFTEDEPVSAQPELADINRKLDRLLAALDVVRPDLADQLDKILTDQKTEAAKADLRARTGSPQRGSRRSRRSA